ncbi:hypothetical protein ACFX2J_016654 [Malus domestica]
MSGFRMLGVMGSGPLEEKDATSGAGFVPKLVCTRVRVLTLVVLALVAYSLIKEPFAIGRTKAGMVKSSAYKSGISDTKIAA